MNVVDVCNIILHPYNGSERNEWSLPLALSHEIVAPPLMSGFIFLLFIEEVPAKEVITNLVLG